MTDEKIRQMTFEEAHKLQLQLIEAGYPAQLGYGDSKWKVQVEAIRITEQNKKGDFL